MKRILSFGEIIFDIYPDGRAHLGGAPLNFAVHAARSGAEAALLSAVGVDDLGRRALEALSTLGVDTSPVTVVEHAETGRCLVTLDAAGVPAYCIAEDTAYDRLSLPAVDSLSYDAIAFGTLALRSGHNRRLLQSLLERGAFSTVFCDLNLRPPHVSEEAVALCLSHAEILKVSDGEWDDLKSLFSIGASDLLRGAVALKAYAPHLRLLLVTCGDAGAYAADLVSGNLYFEAAHPAAVVSTVGAGDSFGAAFLCSYLDGSPIQACLSYAAQRAACVVSQLGAF